MSMSVCPNCWETPCICNNPKMHQLRKQQLRQHVEQFSKDTKTREVLQQIENTRAREMLDAAAIATGPSVTKPILEEAHDVIYGEREQTYGDPGKNLRAIAEFWSTYLDHPVTYQDVCNMMVLMKVARLKNTPGHHDSLVDIAGYTALQDRVNNHAGT